MQLFYSHQITGNVITLPESESRHCNKVLRMVAGNSIKVTDGKGHFYEGVITVSHERSTVVEITSTQIQQPYHYQLHLYVAITKNSERLEWMLEKSVELGLKSFTPIITKRTEKKNIRIDRLQTIALSAMKQSLHAWLPIVNQPIKFENIIQQNLSGTKLFAHCNEVAKGKTITSIQPNQETHIFIGPEGDFTSEEVDMALKNDCIPVELGPARLRTETAGLFSVSWMYLLNLKSH